MKKILLLTFSLFLFVAVSVHAAEMYKYPGGVLDGQDIYTYVGTTDLDVRVEWTPVDNSTGYELEMYSVDRDVYVARAQTSTAGLTLKAPHQGLFIIRIRSVIEPSGVPEYSLWVSSDDPSVALVEGLSRGWWIYAFLAPPGPIE